jgi:predicted S18 family serine protease
LQSAKTTIDEAYAFALKKNYKMCLFKASFAKAESNLLLSSIAVAKDEVDELADQKLSAAHKLIANEQSRGFFPIMGYSYYEYAQSLKENQDIVSTLIFSEYALELGNLEIYFPKKGLSLPFINYSLIPLTIAALLLGLASGILIGLKIKIKKSKAKQGRKKQKKK